MLRTLFVLPWTIPIALSTIAWKWMFHSQFSVVNWMLLKVGVIDQGIQWLGTPIPAMFAVILVSTWRAVPFGAIIVMAGLTALPADVIDAARVDGANWWQRFQRVIVPLIAPILFIAILFDLIFTLTELTVVYLLTGGGPVDQTQVLANYALQVGVPGEPARPGRGHRAVHAAGAADPDDPGAAHHRSTRGRGVIARAVSTASPHHTRLALAAASVAGSAARSLRVITLAIYTLLTVFPFYWMIITTFKQNSDLYSETNNPLWFNAPPTLDNITYLLEQTRFLTWMLNSLIIGVGVVVITLVIVAVPAGYALARLHLPGAEQLGIAIFATYLVPPTLLFIPLTRRRSHCWDCKTRSGRWSSCCRRSRFRSRCGC